MKCPKCGYNSFEIHDSCKKCANDLTGYKDTHGLKSIVLPQAARADLAEKLMSDMSADSHEEAAAVPADMFSFDIPGNEATTVQAAPQDDPFNFDDQPSSPPPSGGDFSFSEDQKSAQARAEEEAFADLLESAPRAPQAASTPAAAAQDQEDLSNFSWDDTPDVVSGSQAKPSDDFNDLFGDTDENAKK
jgi:predicted  nucleic acid-binding Zn-ribbon protein